MTTPDELPGMWEASDLTGGASDETTPEEPTDEEVATQVLAAQLATQANEASKVFFAMMQERHKMGEAKYGPIKFMNVNTLKEALEELADLGNYAMYTFMKVWILDQQLDGIIAEATEAQQAAPGGFFSTLDGR